MESFWLDRATEIQKQLKLGQNGQISQDIATKLGHEFDRVALMKADGPDSMADNRIKAADEQCKGCEAVTDATIGNCFSEELLEIQNAIRLCYFASSHSKDTLYWY